MNLQKFAFPVTIGAAIIGVWAAFRNSGGGSPVIVQAGGITMPSLAPLQSVMPSVIVPQSPGYTAAAPVTQAAIPAPGAAAAPGFQVAAMSNPWAGSPSSPASAPPMRLTYNYGPRMALSKTAAAVPAPSAPGGGCGCHQEAVTPCADSCSENNARYPDGRSGCMVTKPDTRGAGRLALNIAAYWGDAPHTFADSSAYAPDSVSA